MSKTSKRAQTWSDCNGNGDCKTFPQDLDSHIWKLQLLTLGSRQFVTLDKAAFVLSSSKKNPQFNIPLFCLPKTCSYWPCVKDWERNLIHILRI